MNITTPLAPQTIADVTSGKHSGQRVAVLHESSPNVWACVNAFAPMRTLFIESHHLTPQA